MGVDNKELKKRVFSYMNVHPMMKGPRLAREFGDYNTETVIRYYHVWKHEIETLRWLYLHMVEKWAPKKALTKSNKTMLRRIERRIGV